MAIRFYSYLYKDLTAWGNFILECFPQIDDQTWRELNSTYTDEEIYAALKAMSPMKAPGPNYFQVAFLSKRMGDC